MSGVPDEIRHDLDARRRFVTDLADLLVEAQKKEWPKPVKQGQFWQLIHLKLGQHLDAMVAEVINHDGSGT